MKSTKIVKVAEANFLKLSILYEKKVNLTMVYVTRVPHHEVKIFMLLLFVCSLYSQLVLCQ